MIDSLFFRTVGRFLFPAIWIFSAFLFFRGHNAPGGGFIAGLLAAVSFAVIALSAGKPTLIRVYRLKTFTLIRWGLLIAASSGFIGLFTSNAFFKGVWADLYIPLLGNVYVGTPVMFDLGVFLVVLGIGVNFILLLMED
ncbi:Na(+)/H(+) antiporter subunit B [bacterium]|nr:Na(+)/H(+) antiporter subunit B [bacterium]